MKLPEYIEDQQGPYLRRVYQKEFASFDPVSMPWDEFRFHPRRHPDCHVAKLSSVRMVVRMDHQTPDGPERIYVKRALVLSFAKRLGEVIRSSKEWREFNLALKFLKHGINVPLPLYYAEATEKNGTPVRFIVTKALDRRWKVSKKRFKHDDGFDLKWRVIATFTRLLHDSKVLHGDYRSDHIYLDMDRLSEDDPMQCCALIDLDGSQIGRKVTRKDRVRSLRQLAQSLIGVGLTVQDIRDFLGIYDPEDRFQITAEEVFHHAKERHEARMAIRAREGLSP